MKSFLLFYSNPEQNMYRNKSINVYKFLISNPLNEQDQDLILTNFKTKMLIIIIGLNFVIVFIIVLINYLLSLNLIFLY